jgi:hypothetical protein
MGTPKSDSSGSMHNGDWEDFWSCDCEGVHKVDKLQKEISKMQRNIAELKTKNNPIFKEMEYKEKLKRLKREYNVE